MKIDAYFTPYFPEIENQFSEQILIMIDVLRASTSVCAALFNGAKEIIPCSDMQTAVSINSKLGKDGRFLGGERGGLKPDGFDAGNSPQDYSREKVEGKTVIMTTTNGTKTFLKGKEASLRIVAGFVNFNSVLDSINNYVAQTSSSGKDIGVTFLCAGTGGRLSYEDLCCAGAYINHLINNQVVTQMTDTADAANNLFKAHSSDLAGFMKTKTHARHLKEIGFESDIDLCFSFDTFPVVPIMESNKIKIL